MTETGDLPTAGGPGEAGVDTALPPTQAAAPQSAPVSGEGSPCPNEYLCPITDLLMREPVLLVETGHSFEKWAIERWFAQGNRTCPLTGVTLTSIQVRAASDDVLQGFNASFEGLVLSSGVHLAYVKESQISLHCTFLTSQDERFCFGVRGGGCCYVE